MGLCRPECDGHGGPDLPQTWRPWGPGRKSLAAAQSGLHQPVCPVGPGGPGPQAGTGQPPPSIQAPRRGGVRVFKHELSPHDPTPDPACPLPSQQPLHMEALGTGPESCHGRGQDRQADGDTIPHLCPSARLAQLCAQSLGSSAGRTSPRAAAGLGEPAPQTLTPRRVSPSSSWLHPQGEGSRRCCGRSEREGRMRGEKHLLPRTAVRARKSLTPFPPVLSSAATLAETGRVQRKAGGGRGPIWAGLVRACWRFQVLRALRLSDSRLGKETPCNSEGSHERPRTRQGHSRPQSSGDSAPGCGRPRTGTGPRSRPGEAGSPKVLGRHLGFCPGSKPGHSSGMGSSHTGHGPHGCSHGPHGCSHGLRSSRSSPWFWWVEGGAGQRSRWRERRYSVRGLWGQDPTCQDRRGAGHVAPSWPLSAPFLPYGCTCLK